MTTLMVTPYAPYRDGIAAYAVQEVRSRRASGEAVEVVSPFPSAAHHHVPLGGVTGIARLARLARRYERVVIQFFPEMIFGRTRTGAERLAIWSGLAGIAALVPTELRIHEVQYQPMRDHESERRAARRVLDRAARVTVHTEQERSELSEASGFPADRIELIDHGARFQAHVRVSRAEARRRLGLRPDGHIFLCIGFLQAHKGFDRAMQAFLRLDPRDAELHVVGDVRIYHPDLEAHARTLARLADLSDRVHLHRRFVGDSEFDLWLQAADTVVLPYREIWSSGVVERANLFGTPIIAAAVGGLADQGEGIALVANDAELLSAMAAAAGVAELGAAVEEWHGDVHSRSSIQAEIRRRAHTDELLVEAEPSEVQDRLADIDVLDMPEPISLRPWINRTKNLIGRATNWQIHPLVVNANESNAAIRDAITLLEARVAALEDGADDTP
ncbi:MAG: glycosyltransferase family 4 protein [Acidimicrobiales bacterium]|nr:glycosyltransferase family 4 protein [Acidimicrobiales bacterium]